MVFVSAYTIPPENRNAAYDRFKKAGGQPPKGIKLLARWHSAAGGRGVTIFESNDPQAMAAWAQEWSDLVNFDVFPAIDDSTFAKLL